MTYITGPDGLPVITSPNPADIVPVVDVTNTSGGTQPYGTTSQIEVSNLLYQNPSLFYANLFGNGSDGAVTLDGTTAYTAFSSLAGSTYTLTRDVYASSLTVNSGVTLNTGNCRIFCTGTLTNNGTISAAGNAGQASGTAGAASSTNATTLGAGPAGGAGNTGAGTGGTRSGIALGMSGGGGAGGAGASGAGGGSSYANSSAAWAIALAVILNGVAAWGGATGQLSGGPSGGGGGGDGTNHGGGGGGGAGIIAIFARAVVSNGVITAAGGNGGTPATGNCGGGGPGAGGLILLFTLTAWTNNGTTSVAGGTAGSGVGTGVAGGTGGAGSVVNTVLA